MYGWLIITMLISFTVGFGVSEYRGLEICKKSGWEFIDEVTEHRKPYDEYDLIIVRRLQSNLATTCIINYDINSV